MHKLEKGDGCMAMTKEILGWLIDTLAMTLHLVDRWCSRLQELSEEFPQSQKHVSLQKWHKVLRELRFMSLAMPGSRGLFSALQTTFETGKRCLQLTRLVHNFLDDLRWLAEHSHECPARIHELFPMDPLIVGATDASGKGMGRIFFIPTPASAAAAPCWEACVWQDVFPDDIQECLVTWTNPNRDITNSELELAGTVVHCDVIAANFSIGKMTIGTPCNNNMPTVFWNGKGLATTLGPVAQLLRLQALHA